MNSKFRLKAGRSSGLRIAFLSGLLLIVSTLPVVILLDETVVGLLAALTGLSLVSICLVIAFVRVVRSDMITVNSRRQSDDTPHKGKKIEFIETTEAVLSLLIR